MKKRIAFLLSLVLTMTVCLQAAATSNLNSTISYLEKNIGSNSYDGMLDWPILGLAAMSKNVSSFINKRENQIRKGELFTADRSTDYQRSIVGAVAAGKDPRSFGGYNLVNEVKTSQLANGKFGDSIAKGGSNLVNAHVWGIISLYTAGETIPNRDKALKWLVDNQNADGGFSIDTRVKSSDIDMTGMVLIAFGALGETKDHAAVKKAIQYLKNQQGDKGDFTGWGGSSSESLSQVIQGLMMLGIDPGGSEWSKKDGDLVTALLAYRKKDGSFSHALNGDSNTMATYQALIALGDYYRGESIYKKLRRENLRFSDVPQSHFAASAIKKLVAEGVLKGFPDGTFQPNTAVKRQEFATMIALSMNKNKSFSAVTRNFKDVPTSHWANPYIKAVSDQGLMKGRSSGMFAPEETITGAEVMTALVHALGLEGSAKPANGEAWYAGYIRVASKKGLLYPNFDATKPATRAQCAYSLEVLLK
ncbi:Prenyltransferase and squalene oxidase repeat-containing protein [Anaerovirgula multivorans]|uniref:Prenyltransferase and squalene oxidase repeat-containing protein n=1 Tax=Anaerovirgula multivorans TaxID=312168 RepID=A0A239C9H3_9FIRM|nr:S-layer homology domain-containing protein [Anaerovirgula multivorans]SNS16271.1 Prenyltransferase and squalene oxidase repeat-containing protein [Anaerovirgula multivorans]